MRKNINNKGFVLLPMLLLLLPIFMVFGFVSKSSVMPSTDNNIVSTQEPSLDKEDEEINNNGKTELNNDSTDTSADITESEDMEKDDLAICSGMNITINTVVCDKVINKECIARKDKWWFFVKVDKNGNVIIDGLLKTEALRKRLKEELQGLINPKTSMKNSYIIVLTNKTENNKKSLYSITVSVSKHDFSQDVYKTYSE